ncbi:aminoglycoside phosphotransferase family protein [Acidicapsa ligni]|uniref:aminoglycoside phosphotransferase family protein n=1 Tax=Acidicapsa ligni TaxID=542300 RepID=UPI0021E00713|nr:aminoglycoside phosphotransferase family protein [Acidicapsa ligni]
MHPTSLSEIRANALSSTEHDTLTSVLTQGSTGRGPFSRLGWIDEAIEWIQTETRSRGPQTRWRLDQFNASATGSLIRFQNERGEAYWLKSGGSLNRSEMGITSTMASLFPDYLPEIISVHSGWSAWLMRDEGVSLANASTDRRVLEDVVRRIAELQRESCQHTGRLLEDGCHDHRISRLLERLAGLIPYLEDAVQAQEVSTGPRLQPARIRRIRDLFEKAASRMLRLNIPDALMHCDFSVENILISQRGCLFTDWAQASIGVPFVTFEQLRLQLLQTGGACGHVHRLSELYRSQWAELIPAADIETAFTLVPLIAVTCDLCCRPEWLTMTGPDRPLSQSYARTLARRLDRAAKLIEQNSLMCA